MVRVIGCDGRSAPSSRRILRAAVLGVWLLPAEALGQSGPKILVAGVPESELAEIRAVAPRANLVRVADEKAALAQIR